MDTPNALAASICREIEGFFASHPLSLAQWGDFVDRLYTTFLHSQADVGFDALLSILATSPSYVQQSIAGELLLKYAVPCKIDLESFLDILLNNFDLSADKTVRYITKVYGDDVVVAALEERRSRELTKAEQDRLESIFYWLGRHPN